MSGIHVRVRVAEEDFALPVDGVREIARRDRITPVPGAPGFVLGVWNLRGDVIAAVDLAALLGLEGRSVGSRLVVVELGELRAGLAVDEVTEVETLPEPAEELDSVYLQGSVLLDGAPVGIVDLGAVLGAATAEAAA